MYGCYQFVINGVYLLLCLVLAAVNQGLVGQAVFQQRKATIDVQKSMIKERGLEREF